MRELFGVLVVIIACVAISTVHHVAGVIRAEKKTKVNVSAPNP